jgi:DNA repair protein RadC
VKYSIAPLFTLRAVREKGVKYPLRFANDPDKIAYIARAYLHDKDCEHLIVILLDSGHGLIGVSPVAVGGIAGLQTCVRDVMKHAIVHRATAIVLAHNHPSGNVVPSGQDIDFTRRVKEAGALLDVPLVDHVIVSSGAHEGHYSMFEHGDLKGVSS